MLSTLMKNHNSASAANKLICVSQREDSYHRDNKHTDPILNEMLSINYQPFYDFSKDVEAEPKESYFSLIFKNWDKRLFNSISPKRSLSNV